LWLMAPCLAVRFGVIGTGCIGQEHMRNLMLAENCELAAVADPNEAMLAEAKSILAEVPCFANFEDMLAHIDLDAVIVAVPNYKHVEVCEKLAGRVHVLCEKPVATTLEDCARLRRVVEKSAGKLFAVGLEYRHIPPMRKLLQTLPEVGDVKMVTIREHRFPFLRKVGLWNRDNDKSGGTLVEKGCHFFDFFRLCCPEGATPTTVYARGGEAVNHHAPGVVDHAVVVVDFEDPPGDPHNNDKEEEEDHHDDTKNRSSRVVVCTLELSMFAEASKHQLEVSAVGAAGKVEAFAPAHGVKHDDISKPNFRLGLRQPMNWDQATAAPPESHTIGAVEELHVPIDDALMQAGDHSGATYYELLEFARACQQPLAPNNLASVHDATLSVAVGLAAQTSIRERRVVDVRDLLRGMETTATKTAKTATKKVDVPLINVASSTATLLTTTSEDQ